MINTAVQSQKSEYVLNQETSKIELRFPKQEYQALPEELKKEIGSNFLWSNTAGAWVSRSTRNHYRALQVAKKIGLVDGGSEGERLSYAEQLAKKSERAEARAERYEGYAENAQKRGEGLQAELNSYHGDIAFFTQPIIAGHAGSQAFARRREKIYQRYGKGFEEYRKSEYYRQRAETSRETAAMGRLKDPVYLHNRIKEQNSTIKKLQGDVVTYEDKIYRIQQDEKICSVVSGDPLTVEYYTDLVNKVLDKIEYELDKLAFFENCREEVGGKRFSKENIQVGYIVQMRRWGRCEVVSAGRVNIGFKILDGGAAGGYLKEPYAAIEEILEKREGAGKGKQQIKNPYRDGDILCWYSISGKRIIKAYRVVKTTEAGVKLQEVMVENNVPFDDQFKNDKQLQRKIVKSKYSDWVGVYEGNRQLNKYSAEVTK